MAKPKKSREVIAKKIEQLANDPEIAGDATVVMKLQRLANEIRESDAPYDTNTRQRPKQGDS